MVLVDLRNHGRSTDIEGLSPPHDTIIAARDISNLIKSRGWVWPDVVIGHSLGGKVALQYALSCAQGDYGKSAQPPKQVWVLDVLQGKFENKSQYEEIDKALHTLKTLPTPILSQEWLVDHMIGLGISKFISEWISSSLKKSGEHATFSFSIAGAMEMFKSVREMDYWALLENHPKGIEIAIVRTESRLTWEPDVVERLESLAKQEAVTQAVSRFMLFQILDTGFTGINHRHCLRLCPPKLPLWFNQNVHHCSLKISESLLHFFYDLYSLS